MKKKEQLPEVRDIEHLRQLVQEGISSGPGIDAEVVFDRLRARYKKSEQ